MSESRQRASQRSLTLFAIFATLSAIEFKQFGVGLAAAVLIDATIIRGVLLPATMTLLGGWNSGTCRARSAGYRRSGSASGLAPSPARGRPAPNRSQCGALVHTYAVRRSGRRIVWPRYVSRYDARIIERRRLPVA